MIGHRDGEWEHFDPTQWTYRFHSYYKYQFEFVCEQHPNIHVQQGGDRDQIYTFCLDGADHLSWEDICDGMPVDIAQLKAGDNEFMQIWVDRSNEMSEACDSNRPHLLICSNIESTLELTADEEDNEYTENESISESIKGDEKL